MPNYTIVATGSTGTNTGIAQLKSTVDQAKMGIYDVVIGSVATPADQATNFVIARFGVAGTGAALTTALLDQFSVAAISTGREMLTTEPTTLTSLMQIPLNMRASFRWVASPGGELVSRGSPSTGLELRSQSSTTAYLAGGTIFWTE